MTAATTRRRCLATVGVALALLAWPETAHAADPAFGTPDATSTFLTGITFEQPVSGLQAGSEVEVVIETEGSDAPLVVLVEAPARTSQTLTYELDFRSGGAVPSTRFTAHWRLTLPSGEVVLSPPVTVTYDDDRFTWRTLEGNVVRMHWYAGTAAFGREALRIAEAGVADAAALLGVDEREPIDFYVYADVGPFRDVLGPASRENVGGVAYAGVRVLLAQIDPASIGASWIRSVIPHELTHVVFDSAVSNPYHFPPKWLNEGLAVYQSEGYGSKYRNDVGAAVDGGTLMPLDAISGQFPTSLARFSLAYGESVSAVDFLVRTYGRDELVQLIRSYARGVSDDEAFRAALGVDVAGFQAAWLADLGAVEPAAFGPQAAPPGPLPSDWQGPAPTPGVPIASPAVSTAPSPLPTAPPDGDRGGDNNTAALVAAGLLFAALAIGGAAWWQRGRAGAARPDADAGP